MAATSKKLWCVYRRGFSNRYTLGTLVSDYSDIDNNLLYNPKNFDYDRKNPSEVNITVSPGKSVMGHATRAVVGTNGRKIQLREPNKFLQTEILADDAACARLIDHLTPSSHDGNTITQPKIWMATGIYRLDDGTRYDQIGEAEAWTRFSQQRGDLVWGAAWHLISASSLSPGSQPTPQMLKDKLEVSSISSDGNVDDSVLDGVATAIELSNAQDAADPRYVGYVDTSPAADITPGSMVLDCNRPDPQDYIHEGIDCHQFEDSPLVTVREQPTISYDGTGRGSETEWHVVGKDGHRVELRDPQHFFETEILGNDQALEWLQRTLTEPRPNAEPRPMTMVMEPVTSADMIEMGLTPLTLADLGLEEELETTEMEPIETEVMATNIWPPEIWLCTGVAQMGRTTNTSSSTQPLESYSERGHTKAAQWRRISTGKLTPGPSLAEMRTELMLMENCSLGQVRFGSAQGSGPGTTDEAEKTGDEPSTNVQGSQSGATNKGAEKE